VDNKNRCGHNLFWIDNPFSESDEKEGILFNSGSLGCLWVSDRKALDRIITKYISGEKLSHDEKNKIDILMDNQLLLDCNTSVIKTTTAKESNSPTLFLDITKGCNLQCKYCFADTNCPNGSSDNMPESIAYHAIDKFISQIEKNSQKRASIIFFGGEPLLNFPLIHKVIGHTVDRIGKTGIKIKYGITTNFTLVDDAILQYMKENIDDVLVSIDGITTIQNELRTDEQGNNSLQSILENLEKADRIGVSYGIRCTISSSNVNTLSNIIDYFVKKPNVFEIDFVAISPFNATGNIIDEKYYPDINEYVNQLKRIYREHFEYLPKIAPFSIYINQIQNGGRDFPCGVMDDDGISVIDVNGDIYPCVHLTSIKQFMIENICDATTCSHSVRRNLKENTKKYTEENCSECPYLRLCQTHCALVPIMDQLGFTIPPYAKQYWKKIICAQTKTCVDLILWGSAKNLK
jgi:uncharacterized protein